MHETALVYDRAIAADQDVVCDGLSEYFDVIAWSWKPMGPYPKSLGYPWLDFNLYRLNETGYEFVDGVGTIVFKQLHRIRTHIQRHG